MMIDIALFTLSFLASYFLSLKGSYLFSGLILMVCGIVLCVRRIKETKNIIDPITIFSLSWITCCGISALKLSNLQTQWNVRTWIVFYLIFLSFYVGNRFFSSRFMKREPKTEIKTDASYDVFPIMPVLTGISLICFFIEAILLGYVPLFTVDVPHAYSEFHISGLHYFTVLFVLEPSFFVYYLLKGKKSGRRNAVSIACTVICLLLPILLVSRFQLIFGILIACFTFLILKKHELKSLLTARNILIMLAGALLLLCCYVFITIERAHSVEYLNGIFEMKDPNMPIFLTQPYIYIANNFDNFNCLVECLSDHTYGLKQLFPAFALTGLKFRYPELVNFPLYVTKEELTTVTMFYDAYYDFGIAGCVLMSLLLGGLYFWIGNMTEKHCKAIYVVIAAQLFSYLLLAFFTTWFSNPTTWFYLIICIAMEVVLCYLYSRQNKERKCSK